MCGIFLYFSVNKKRLIEDLILQNNNIQHRGQDCFGFIYNNDLNLINCNLNSKEGIIKNFDNQEVKNIETNLFLSHLRYKTSGRKNNKKIQPILSKNKFGYFAFVFNGNIPRKYYKTEYNDIDIDTDLILKYLEQTEEKNWDTVLKKFLFRFERSYSMIVITEKNIYFVKDRYGVRPFCYSINEDQLEASSESCGLSISNKNEIEAGTILKISFNSIFSIEKIYQIEQPKALCLFETFYFMSPKSIWYNNNIEEIRKLWGIELAKKDKEFKNNKDILVIGAPVSGIIPAIEYAKSLNLQYNQAITKNPEVNRTFILNEDERDKISKIKYIYDKDIINNKKIVIVDDSIVRGITMKNLIKNIYLCGAKEVHIRIISPQIKDICLFGINIESKKELISANNNIEEINKIFNSTSLKFLELELMLSHLKKNIQKNMCTGCFNSDYKNYNAKILEW